MKGSATKELDVGDRETVLEAVLFTGYKADQFVTVAYQRTNCLIPAGGIKLLATRSCLKVVTSGLLVEVIQVTTKVL